MKDSTLTEILTGYCDTAIIRLIIVSIILVEKKENKNEVYT